MRCDGATFGTRLAACLIAWLLGASTAAAQTETFEARDSLRADEAIADLAWTPQTFAVTVEPGVGAFDALVGFPSPLPSGEAAMDRVTMWWYVARDDAGEPMDAPAVLLVHSLHARMPIAQLLAANLLRRGRHCFVIHLPGYAGRREAGWSSPGVTVLERARQAVADVRRARDVIAVLPHIRPGRVAIEGTSLGGFVASVAAGLDGAFEPVFLLLSGGDVQRVLAEGQADAARLRRRMQQAGYTDADLVAMLEPFEPLRVAARLNPAATFLYSARFDQVIPAACSFALSQAIGLDERHHLWYDGDHYTAAIFLPGIIEHMLGQMADDEVPASNE